MRSENGLVVRFFKRAWWAEVTYRVFPEDAGLSPQTHEDHIDQLGPFKRPRNAMVEAERHETMLRNRFGDRMVFGGLSSGIGPINTNSPHESAKLVPCGL